MTEEDDIMAASVLPKVTSRPVCPYCNQPANLVYGSQVYGNRSPPEIARLRIWSCKGCRAHTRCHPNSLRPMGTLAREDLRKARQEAHKALDSLWTCRPRYKERKAARQETYLWLQQAMGLTESECHIGLFNIEQCRRVIELCEERKSNDLP